jgi:predicted enzyme related to lactoylglutathione lyase
VSKALIAPLLYLNMVKKITNRGALRQKKLTLRANKHVRLAGVELYFDNLDAAKEFYRDRLGLKLHDEQPGHHAQFDGGAGFICCERKGAENYPSADKAVLFFEVANLGKAMARIGNDRIIRREPTPCGRRPAWAVLHDPEGHNILLLEKKSSRPRS